VLRCRLSRSLWHALQERHRATGESIAHIVRAALADALQVAHSTLFQISSSVALVEGIYQGEITVRALREHGAFDRVRTRAMCRTDSGVPLAEAAAHQAEFALAGVRGTLVGFWSPHYGRALAIPGYHVHFITDDRSAGGHVLDCAGHGLRLQVQREVDLRLSLPESAQYLRADLTRDPSADLDRAER
jgi:acetolactate decarboxylase